jgi:hypothetical protein
MIALAATELVLLAAPAGLGAIVWDGEGGTNYWFNPLNWNRDMNDNMTLPPGNATTGATDTQINAAPAGGVLYDPETDPSYPPPGSITFPAGFTGVNGQRIQQLYISRNTPNTNVLTIDGDLELTGTMIVGRSSGTAGVATNGRVNQTGGTVKVNLAAIDLGATDTSNPGLGDGAYDYNGGILEVSLEGGSGLRISHGGSAGTGGQGRFIMRKPDSPGYVRAYDFNVASHLGIAGNPGLSADGITRGHATVEFHSGNDGTRPIQVLQNLVINNGTFTNTSGVTGTRTARLELVLDQAPNTDGGGVPQNLGLFDVDFFDPDQIVDPVGSNTTGDGSLADYFSSADGSIHYTPGTMVSAVFGSTQYNWTISYSGNIVWDDPDAGILDSISGTGGLDVVLLGHSSISLGVPGDYNDDGKVDAADYAIWRKYENTSTMLPNDPTGGMIGTAQYNTWRNNFGMMEGAGSGSSLATAAVPEPAAIMLMMAGLFGAALARRTR